MQDKITQEVQDALTAAPEEIIFEQLQNEDSSPLNQPVIEKDIGGEPIVVTDEEQQKSWNVWKPKQEQQTNDKLEPERSGNSQTNFRSTVEQHVAKEKANEPLDAPEQEIDGNTLNIDEEDTVTDKEFKVPLSQANQAADALLGMTNNVMAVGGGYFVKINKHKEFYEFDEILKVIDTQNEKNVARIKLDKEDQALLRPLLAQVLQKKAKKLTPEQQLMGAAISILMKKAQVVMEVRAENNLLEDRILDIIREEKGYSAQDNLNEEMEKNEEVAFERRTEPTQEKAEDTSEKKETESQQPKPDIQDIEAEQVDEDASILEVAEEPKATS